MTTATYMHCNTLLNDAYTSLNDTVSTIFIYFTMVLTTTGTTYTVSPRTGGKNRLH